jgi:hypothetical protein
MCEKYRTLSCLLLCAILSLAACGGGGGSSSASAPPLSPGVVTGGLDNQGVLESFDGDNDLGNLGDSGGLKTSLTSGNYLEVSGGLQVELYDDYSINIKIPYVSSEEFIASDGDIRLYGDESGTKLLVGEKDVDGDGGALTLMNAALGDSYPYPELPEPREYDGEQIGSDETFTGTIAYSKQILTLNAGLVDLEHSSFGSWALELTADGTLKTPEGTETLAGYKETYYLPLSGGDSNALKEPAADGIPFVGKAMAMATDDGHAVPLQRFFTGDAELTVDGSGGSLELSFPNFYKIGFDLAVTGSGFEAANNSSVTVTDNGNTSGITLNQDTIEKAKNSAYADLRDDTYLTGSFYGGPSEANASEATGRFNVYSEESDRDIYVSGSFGVVVKP